MYFLQHSCFYKEMKLDKTSVQNKVTEGARQE